MQNTRERTGTLAVSVDFFSKGSQSALRWAVENIANRGQTLKLIHVKPRTPLLPPFGNNDFSIRREPDNQTMDLFLSFRCFCMRRQVECEIVVLEHPDIANALIECVIHYGIEALVIGTSPRNGLSRLFKNSDIASSIKKMAPDFCTLYVISKGRLAHARSASCSFRAEQRSTSRRLSSYDQESVGSSISRDGRTSNRILQDELSSPEFNLSFAGSERSSTDDTNFMSFYKNLGNSQRSQGPLNRANEEINDNLKPLNARCKSFDVTLQESESERSIWLSQKLVESEHVENKVRRLELELKQTGDMYRAACKAAVREKQKAREFQRMKVEGEERLEKAKLATESALAIVEKEKQKCKEAMEAAKETLKIAQMKSLKEAEDKRRRVLKALGHSNLLLKYHIFFHVLAFIFLIYFYLN